MTALVILQNAKAEAINSLKLCSTLFMFTFVISVFKRIPLHLTWFLD